VRTGSRRHDRQPRRSCASPAVSVPMWQVTQWIDIPDVTMSTALCQSYVGYGQSPNLFWAWRVPIASPIVPDQLYQLPLVATAL